MSTQGVALPLWPRPRAISARTTPHNALSTRSGFAHRPHAIRRASSGTQGTQKQRTAQPESAVIPLHRRHSITGMSRLGMPIASSTATRILRHRTYRQQISHDVPPHPSKHIGTTSVWRRWPTAHPIEHSAHDKKQTPPLARCATLRAKEKPRSDPASHQAHHCAMRAPMSGNRLGVIANSNLAVTCCGGNCSIYCRAEARFPPRATHAPASMPRARSPNMPGQARQ